MSKDAILGWINHRSFAELNRESARPDGIIEYDPSFAGLSQIIAAGYSWAATYSAGSDAYVYRRFKGPLPERALKFAREPRPDVAAFCEEHGCDVAVYDELKGCVRKPRVGSDEAP